MIRKSHAANVICTLLFGPLGLLYASIWQGLVVFTLYVILGLGFLARDNTDIASSLSLAGLGFVGQLGWGGVIAWLAPMILGALVVNDHNEDVKEYDSEVEQRHQELLEAMRNRG